MKKCICLHGHFYQPPRENAWLEHVAKQASAAPYHDWNERISAECYGPNGASRILNEEQKIISIVNNYAHISFNFGPTLLSWMEMHDPATYHKVLEADAQSAAVSGHGNAIAQVYNHLIMPLANARDKETQVKWGIADFISRFGRKPEGMWLAETAVDLATLEVLAEQNIQFTILAPRQAAAVRLQADAAWKELNNESELDFSIPYICHLPSGKQITLFFYNGPISRDVAFNGLLNSGKAFADALLHAFPENNMPSRLVHIATDGETFGHHHYHGDMALAACIQFLLADPDIELLNYATYLEKYPAVAEVQIHENSSWSCVHGIERWRSDCGCSDGAHAGYDQKWRAPLRKALNWLRDQTATLYEKAMLAYTPDPWHVRNAYISVVLDRTDNTIRSFFAEQFSTVPDAATQIHIIRLLEMQRHALLMFTSCGWFFDEISRIETRQILQYADRVIQIAENELHVDMGEPFAAILSEAPSNIEKIGNGANLYLREIKPQRLTLTKVGIHHAILSLFNDVPGSFSVYNYTVESTFFEKLRAGNLILAAGRFTLVSKFTFAEQHFDYALCYLGGLHMVGGYASEMDEDVFEEMFLSARDAFRRDALQEVFSIIDKAFPDSAFSFTDVFEDEQESLMQFIMSESLHDAEKEYEQIYARTFSMMQALKRQNRKVPAILERNLFTVVNVLLKRELSSPQPNRNTLDQLADISLSWKVPLDKEDIGFAAAMRLIHLTEQLNYHVDDLHIFDIMSRILIRLNDLGIAFPKWKIQNAYFNIGRNYIGNTEFMRSLGEDAYNKWLIKCKAVGEQLQIRF